MFHEDVLLNISRIRIIQLFSFYKVSFIYCFGMSDKVNIEKSSTVELDAMVDMLVQQANVSKETVFNDAFLSEDLLRAFQLNKTHKYYIDAQPLNEFRDLEGHLELMNQSLNNEKLYIGFVQTLSDWRKSKKILRIPILGMSYRVYTFLVKRVIPRLKIYKKNLFSHRSWEN